MRIALLGYGKMGKRIEAVALQRQHQISFKVSDEGSAFNFANTDVAIDFSVPSAAVINIKNALDAGIPVISGTTGWLDQYDEVLDYCKSKNGTFLYASNFSLGVNIFFEVNNYLSELMAKVKGYETQIEEIHHTEKLDAPSGTAISLANQIIENTRYTNWALGHKNPETIPITAKRIENVPGTHEVVYNSEVDTIAIKHTAHSREGFALGAVIAAEWIKNKKGIYNLKDVLNIG